MEISKPYRIILIINMVACLVYGVLYAFVWWWWLRVIDYAAPLPFYAQFFGGVLIIALFWYLRIVLQKIPWEKAVHFIEFTLALMAMIILYLAYEILFKFPVMSATARINSIVSTSVVGVLLVTNIIFFFTESAKHK